MGTLSAGYCQKSKLRTISWLLWKATVPLHLRNSAVTIIISSIFPDSHNLFPPQMRADSSRPQRQTITCCRLVKQNSSCQLVANHKAFDLESGSKRWGCRTAQTLSLESKQGGDVEQLRASGITHRSLLSKQRLIIRVVMKGHCLTPPPEHCVYHASVHEKCTLQRHFDFSR